MSLFRNLGCGAALAAICLAPAASADASRLMSGQPIAPALIAVAGGTANSPVTQAAMGLLPCLLASAFARLATAQPGHE